MDGLLGGKGVKLVRGGKKEGWYVNMSDQILGIRVGRDCVPYYMGHGSSGVEILR